MAIETGSLLHDIGKLAIDDYILNKPGRLSKQEFEKMKMHAPAGHEILQQIKFPFPVAEYVRHHHENWDGTGYPDGLKGEAIPLGSRIIMFADTIDAMTTDRPYRAALDATAVRKELLRFRSTQFDPAICDALLRSAEYSKPFPAGATEASNWIHTTPERGSVLRAAVS